MLGTLVLLSAAHASPGLAVMLPGDVVADADKVESHVKRRIARPALRFEGADRLPEAESIRQTLLMHANECVPTLTEDQTGALAALQQEVGDELYLAVPLSTKAKQTALWRFDPRTNVLMRVIDGTGFIAPPQTPPAEVRLLKWPETDQDATAVKGKWLEAYGAPTVAVVDGQVDLIDQLLEHPNECFPEIDGHAVGELDRLQAEIDGTLFVAVTVPRGRDRFVWRYEPEQLRLTRIAAN